VRWLWPPYLPQAKISLPRDNGFVGKITFCLALAAIISSGGKQPCADLELGSMQSGISKHTLRRVKEELGIVAQWQGFGSYGYWQLPGGQ